MRLASHLGRVNLRDEAAEPGIGDAVAIAHYRCKTVRLDQPLEAYRVHQSSKEFQSLSMDSNAHSGTLMSVLCTSGESDTSVILPRLPPYTAPYSPHTLDSHLDMQCLMVGFPLTTIHHPSCAEFSWMTHPKTVKSW